MLNYHYVVDSTGSHAGRTARARYYRETDYVDWALYHHAPWRRAVWEQLAQAELIDFVPLLTASEIGQWRTRTLHWFDQPPAAPLIEPRFFYPGTGG